MNDSAGTHNASALDSAVRRLVAQTTEHGEVSIDPAILFSGNELDLYDDVIAKGLFRIAGKGKGLVIQAGSYVGLIPINDRFALEVRTRVPVGNIEKMLAVADGVLPRVIPVRNNYGETDDQPASILDVIIDELIDAVEGLRQEGIFRAYKSRFESGSNISGRVLLWESRLTTQRRGQPSATFSRFDRSVGNIENVCIRTGVEIALRTLRGISNKTGAKRRIARLIAAVELFAAVKPDFGLTFLNSSTLRRMEHLPSNRPMLSRAVRAAQLICRKWGVSVRERGRASLPTIAINMEDVFESYVRASLTSSLSTQAEWTVLDGNKNPPQGIKGVLFRPGSTGLFGNSATSPDTVLCWNGVPALVVETKYKPQNRMPTRDELDQIIAYGLAYGCTTVALVYPRSADVPARLMLGRVGNLSVYMATLDLSSPSLEQATMSFVQGMVELAQTH